MKVAVYQYKDASFSRNEQSDNYDIATAQLLLCFGAKYLLQGDSLYLSLREMCPNAEIVLCSTSGEIYGNEVFDNTATISIIKFADVRIVATAVDIANYSNTLEAGKALFQLFDRTDLSAMLVLSDGSKINGSELVMGINHYNATNILIIGGLAGDGDKFESTLVGLNEPAVQGMIIGIGLYGSKLKVSHGSQGGWDMFGLEKMVTRSERNVLYEIENGNALEYYKKYLGNEADGLPGSALLFPLSIKLPGSDERVVRTILSIDEEQGSMTFAGDIPEGASVKFMRANFDKITNAAAIAATHSLKEGDVEPDFALLISCVGRKLILQARIDEEIEAVDEIFKGKTLLAGFYSYGEISPVVAGGGCQLHNQTMTITTFYEAE